MTSSAAEDRRSQTDAQPTPPRRALPGHSIDLIRDGVSADAVRRRGHDPSVWSALVATAMSAANRGWSAADFVTLVLEPRSQLGAQASLKKGKIRGRAQTIQLVRDAWDRAERNIRRSPAWTAEDLRQRAEDRQRRLARDLEEASLTEAENLVMRHVAQRLAETGSLQRAISRQDFIDETGLGKTALETAQRRLMTRGLLVQVEKGAPGGPKAGKRRAHVWALSDGQEQTAAKLPVVGRRSSNTGNRYVAPTPTRDATRRGAPNFAADSGLGEASIEPAVRHLVRLLQMTHTAPESREVLLLSWPSADEQQERESESVDSSNKLT